jgi:Uma2 family endonuclease
LPAPHLFTVHDYHKMAEIGVLTEDSRVELIEGEILDMAPIGEGHFGHVNRFNRVFSRAFSDRSVVSIQNPVRLGLRSEPQPDVVLLRPRSDDYMTKFPLPEDVLLLVEVAESPLSYDRETKARLYARAGIQEYWIVNLIDSEIIVLRDPARARYRSIQVYRRGDAVSPLAFPNVSIDVADVLG